MEIIRIEGNVTESKIEGEKVNKLPGLLRERMIKLLDKLRGVKRIIVENGAEDAIFELTDQNFALVDYLSQKDKKEFIRTIGLLQWYREPHWHGVPPSMGMRIGVKARCSECGLEERSFGDDYCFNDECPSHKMWRQIVPSYEPPRDPLLVALEKQMGGKKKLNKAIRKLEREEERNKK